ncbi:MAG: DTW domain-containing protein [Verrucomicrobiota bacterium]
MGRSLVTSRTARCAQCRFPPRWCICAAHTVVACPLQVDVLMHHREFWRPTSTGRLVNRVMAGARLHLYRHEQPPTRGAVARPDRELWILHPRGEAVPAGAAPARAQVLLLDGSWGEAARMATHVAGWGRLIRLPDAGESRNSLRRQEQPGQYSTVESLLFLLGALGLGEAAAQLRLQFELHVYAGLRTRGARVQAEAFLADSPVRAAFPELLAEMHRPRPLI